jgi:hypothetical protein
MTSNIVNINGNNTSIRYNIAAWMVLRMIVVEKVVTTPT